MKKIIFLLIISLLVFSGCSEIETNQKRDVLGLQKEQITPELLQDNWDLIAPGYEVTHLDKMWKDSENLNIYSVETFPGKNYEYNLLKHSLKLDGKGNIIDSIDLQETSHLREHRETFKITNGEKELEEDKSYNLDFIRNTLISNFAKKYGNKLQEIKDDNIKNYYYFEGTIKDLQTEDNTIFSKIKSFMKNNPNKDIVDEELSEYLQITEESEENIYQIKMQVVLDKESYYMKYTILTLYFNNGHEMMFVDIREDNKEIYDFLVNRNKEFI